MEYKVKCLQPENTSIWGNFHSDLNLMACKEYYWWVLTLDGNVYSKIKNIFINTKRNTNLIKSLILNINTFHRSRSVKFILKL